MASNCFKAESRDVDILPLGEAYDLSQSKKKEVSIVDARKTIRKIDLRLLPFVFLFIILSLDRTNIGNAKIAGLVTDLKLTGLQYNLCAAIFFVPYCFLEIPSNLALKLTRPSQWLPLTMLLWGCVVISTAFVKNFPAFLATRILLGATEAGLFPGITLYLCTWYPRAFQAQRVAVITASSSLAGAFGGFLASGLQRMDGINGLAGWSWIFLIEGLVTAAVALVAFFLMYDHPQNASFLTEAEREWLIEALKKDDAGLSTKVKWKFLTQALRDPRAYLLLVLLFFVQIPNYAFALFIPTIVNGLGFSAVHAQLLAVPPSIAAFVFTLIAGALADRFRVRGPLVLAGCTAALIGHVVLFTTESPGVAYAGIMIAACGLSPMIAISLSWTGGNMGGEMKKAVVLALVIGLGNLGGVVSSFVYRPQDAPRYRPGQAAGISCICVVMVICTIAMLEFSRLNRKKVAQCVREGITEDRAEEFVDSGDASPLYRYTI